MSHEKTADVVVEVAQEKFRAHHLIMQACAPALGAEDNITTSLTITDMSTQNFSVSCCIMSMAVPFLITNLANAPKMLQIGLVLGT